MRICLTLIFLLFCGVPAAQERLNIKGVSIGQTIAELPPELAAGCTGNKCSISFPTRERSSSPLSTIVGGRIKFWTVELEGTPASVIKITAAMDTKSMQSVNIVTLTEALAEKFKAPTCSPSKCVIVSGTDTLRVLYMLTADIFAVTIESERSEARDKAIKTKAKADL